MNIYAVDFVAKCPSNGARIKYALKIETEDVVMVEDLQDFIDERTAFPMYHEALADLLAANFSGLHTMKAHHHGVDITTTRAAEGGGSAP